MRCIKCGCNIGPHRLYCSRCGCRSAHDTEAPAGTRFGIWLDDAGYPSEALARAARILVKQMPPVRGVPPVRYAPEELRAVPAGVGEGYRVYVPA